MTVYVDDMYRSAAGRLGRMKMSHMIADTDAELHAMSARIGVARRHFQGDHYDVALSRRARAVAAGAVEITWRQCGLMIANRTVTGSLGDPATCEQVFRDRLAAARDRIGQAKRAAISRAAARRYEGRE